MVLILIPIWFSNLIQITAYLLVDQLALPATNMVLVTPFVAALSKNLNILCLQF